MNKKVQIKKKPNFFTKIVIFLVLLNTIFSSNVFSAKIYNIESIEQIIKQKKISINIKDKSLKFILLEMQKISGIGILFKDIPEINSMNNISIEMKNATVEEILDKLFVNGTLTYSIVDNTITIIKKPAANTTAKKVANLTVSGRIIDATTKKPIVGATVIVLGTNMGCITEINGEYKIAKVPEQASIEVSFVGYTTSTAKVINDVMNFEMQVEAFKVDNVIVSGYFRKTKQSNTGAEVHVRGEDLRQVGSLNFLQAISVFDPSVRTIESNEFGSDPNRVPEITVRGENGFDLRSSADDSKSNPNAPMYILDGLEVTATRVYDLDMNRIESFTILKDASATSLYGSRGANGVIIITTIAPKIGELKVSVNSNFNLSIPDFRDYNLMNAAEKLEYERLAGEYKAVSGKPMTQDELDYLYNEKLKEVVRGVDTYWLSQPVRASLNQRYNMFIEGGDRSFRYGVSLKYDTDKGVMKGSGRDKIGASINLNYNINQKFFIINDVTINDVTAKNSPYGSLSDYAQLNPYERIYDPNTGELIKRYKSNALNMLNPLYNASLPNFNEENYTEIENNLNLDWRISDHFRVNGRIGITKKSRNTEVYRSPYSTDFEKETDVKNKGSYDISHNKDFNVDGNITASYNNTFNNDITLSTGIGSNLTTQNSIGDGYVATGFLNDNMNFIQFAQQFRENSTPTGSFDKSKMIGFFGNVNVGYANRYFVDISGRTDGSSRFGKNSRFAPFWSAGLAWNLDKENWWVGEGSMKIRASVGSTGTVNFSADQALTKYKYSPSDEYNGSYGAVLMGYGNPSLKWQNTLQYNVGVDMNIWRNIITLNLDAYLKETQNLLLPIDVAPSTGFRSYTENMGSMENKGVDLRLRFNVIRNRVQDLNWSVTLAASHNSNQIKKLSNALEAMNEEANKLENVTSTTPLRTYQEGRSQSALMVVRSLGIDPATGNEVFLKLDGTTTFDYDAKDKIVIGDINPKLQGNIQSNLTYKGFNIFFVFRYEFGAVQYNSTLAQKVEGSNPQKNADKRVLYNRWKNPGDIAMFRRIDDQSAPYQTTRLVQDNNVVRLQTLSLSYQLSDECLAKTSIERAKITFSMSDLFRIATIKQERGTSYPFAQTFSVGLNVTF